MSTDNPTPTPDGPDGDSCEKAIDDLLGGSSPSLPPGDPDPHESEDAGERELRLDLDDHDFSRDPPSSPVRQRRSFFRDPLPSGLLVLVISMLILCGLAGYAGGLRIFALLKDRQTAAKGRQTAAAEQDAKLTAVAIQDLQKQVKAMQDEDRSRAEAEAKAKAKAAAEKKAAPPAPSLHELSAAAAVALQRQRGPEATGGRVNSATATLSSRDAQRLEQRFEQLENRIEEGFSGIEREIQKGQGLISVEEIPFE